jgi:hypothetical protein
MTTAIMEVSDGPYLEAKIVGQLPAGFPAAAFRLGNDEMHVLEAPSDWQET